MNKKEIVKLARKAGASRRYWGNNKEGFASESDEQLEHFVKAVLWSDELFQSLIDGHRVAAYEDAAKLCDEYGNSVNNEWNKELGVADDLAGIAEECAEAIRARIRK